MKLLSTYSQNKSRARQTGGFTLIEIVVVIAMLTTLLGMGLLISMDSYRGYSFRSERGIVVSVLSKARSRALNNMYQTPWGVCLDDVAHMYVIFRGSTYFVGASTNESIPTNMAVTMSGFPLCSSGSGVVFSQLTGTLVPQRSPATDLVVSVTQNTRTSDITINNEGTINW